MQRHTKLFTVLLVCFVIVICATFFLQVAQITFYKNQASQLATSQKQMEKELAKHQERAANLKNVVITSKSTNSPNSLVGDIITSYVNNTQGNVSIYYKNLTSGETVMADGERMYYMASLYKVIVTLFVLDEIKDGALSLSEKTGRPPITIEQALNKIITESNNEYALSFAETIGWDTLETAITKKLDISFTFNKSLEANVVNMGALFEKIAESLRITDEQSTYMLDLLNRQTRQSKLPKYLPQHIYAHNKTGEYEQFSHDAGIFYTPKANYILVFMSKSPNPGVTNEQMAKMSKDIYSALNEL